MDKADNGQGQLKVAQKTAAAPMSSAAEDGTGNVSTLLTYFATHQAHSL